MRRVGHDLEVLRRAAAVALATLPERWAQWNGIDLEVLFTDPEEQALFTAAVRRFFREEVNTDLRHHLVAADLRWRVAEQAQPSPDPVPPSVPDAFAGFDEESPRATGPRRVPDLHLQVLGSDGGFFRFVLPAPW